MAQWLTALTALPENPGSVPSLQLSITPFGTGGGEVGQGDPLPFSGLFRHLTHMVYIHVFRQNTIYIKNKNKSCFF